MAPLDDLPGEIDVRDRDATLADYLRDYRFHGPEGVATGEGTQPYIDGSVFADGVQPLWAAIKRAGQNLVLTDAQGKALEAWAIQKGLDGRLPAVGSTGFVIADVSATGSKIFAKDELKTESGVRFQCAATSTYLPGALIPIAGLDTGPSTNLDAGTVLAWSSPRPGCGPTALVWKAADGSGLSGGRDAETDSELLDRILFASKNPPASGNDAAYQTLVQKTPGLAIQRAFTYAAILGPGTIAIVFTMRPDTVGGSRLPNGAALAAVEAFVKGAMPADDGVFVCQLLAAPVDVVLRIDWATSAAGWEDAAPWPPYGPDLVTVSSATSPTAFVLAKKGLAIPSPLPGTTLAFYDASEKTFQRKKVASVSGTGPWTIVCDVADAASDGSFTPAAGDRVMPWSDSLATVLPAVLGYFDALGPGEQKAVFFDPGLRQRRSPASQVAWPSMIGNRLATAVQDVTAVDDAVLVTPGTLPTPTPTGVPGVFSYLFVLEALAVYPLT